MDEKLYHEALLEHYKYPKYRKPVQSPNFNTGLHNPSCGDKISIEGTVTNGIITEIGFSGSGCVISQAAASMLTEAILGKSVREAAAINTDEIVAMIGIPLGPTRLKCALLCLDVLHQGIAPFLKQ